MVMLEKLLRMFLEKKEPDCEMVVNCCEKMPIVRNSTIDENCTDDRGLGTSFKLKLASLNVRRL